MGLAEKRAAKAFQDQKFPQVKNKVKKAVGFDLPIEVDWESLSWEGTGEQYDKIWSKACFDPLAEALGAICSDEMGKEAVKKELKKVRIEGNYAHSLQATFENGVLTLDFRLYNEPDAEYCEQYKSTIRKALEEKL